MNPILIILITSVIAVFGWIARDIINKIHSIQDTLQKHLIDDAMIAGTIVGIKPQLDKLEEKIDAIIDRELR